jgi:hypothetical protein
MPGGASQASGGNGGTAGGAPRVATPHQRSSGCALPARRSAVTSSSTGDAVDGRPQPPENTHQQRVGDDCGFNNQEDHHRHEEEQKAEQEKAQAAIADAGAKGLLTALLAPLGVFRWPRNRRSPSAAPASSAPRPPLATPLQSLLELTATGTLVRVMRRRNVLK